MQLPVELRAAIEREANAIKIAKLKKAADQLSIRYRRQQTLENSISTPIERIGYAVVRMPATYAAARMVLGEMRRLLPDARMESLLDLGAGLGAAGWAAADLFEELQQIVCVEKDEGLIRLGKSFAQNSTSAALRSALWQRLDMRAADAFPPSDLVIFSYSLGEIEIETAQRLFMRALNGAQKAVAIVEPGTTKGFELIKRLREKATGAGWHLAAPCPHERACPMKDGNWCHFAQRVERTALHRKLKAGELGYEDEKFSYLILAKHPALAAQARVLRHPQIQKGHIKLELCVASGELATLTVTRHNKEGWRIARKVQWGGELEGGITNEKR